MVSTLTGTQAHMDTYCVQKGKEGGREWRREAPVFSL